MPSRPKKRCTYPGCAKLLPGGWKSRCKAHTVKDTRPSSYHRGYDSNWKKIRRLHMSEYPLCADCLADGRYTPASEVHHVLAIRKGGTHDPSNMLSLCRVHHQQRTGRGE